MKAYPSITTKIDFTKPAVVFDKLDGSNIRAEWSPKQGFYKFGSRTQLLTPDQTQLYPAIDKILADFGEELSVRFRQKKMERAVAFFEYGGPNSFAGSHPDPVEDLTATIIDVSVYKKGFMAPDAFIQFTDGLRTPRVLFRGRMDEDFFQSVRHSTLPGMTFEGVVGKSLETVHSEGGPIMFKIKSNAWLDKLKTFCNNDEQMFNRLK
jgi:hypothetical protein